MILILINVQYLLNALFSFEKDLNDQNHSLRFALPDKKIPQQNFPLSPYPLTLFWKPCYGTSNMSPGTTEHKYTKNVFKFQTLEPHICIYFPYLSFMRLNNIFSKEVNN